MARPVARLSGYTELLVALRALPKAQQTTLRAAFRAIGQLVASEGQSLLERLLPDPAKTAGGLKPYVRLRGVEVDQTLRKTTGLRPDWGATQMRRGLLPAAETKTPEIVAGIDAAMSDAQTAVGL